MEWIDDTTLLQGLGIYTEDREKSLEEPEGWTIQGNPVFLTKKGINSKNPWQLAQDLLDLQPARIKAWEEDVGTTFHL